MRRRRYRTHRRTNNGGQAGVDIRFVALPDRNKRTKVELMGHNRGRDNVKKRAKRRRKTERLILAKQSSSHNRKTKAKARQGKKKAA